MITKFTANAKRRQCNKTFYCSNLLPFHGNTTILCQKDVYLGYNHGMAVNYQGKKFYNIDQWKQT